MDINDFFKNLFTTESENWFYGHIPAAQTPGKEPSVPISENHQYLQIDLKSLRVVNSRKGFSKFYGVVHSFIKVPHIDTDDLEFHVVTTPTQLKELDGKNIDRVIPVNIPLLGQVPYIGSGIQIQLGLFSVKSTDLTAPVISLLSDMSETAGVSFIGAALPYAKFLNRGISVLTGSEDNTVLEIGLSTTLTHLKTGYYVIMRAPKDQIDLDSLNITGDDYKLSDSNNRSIKDYPYLVFQVSACPNRLEWFKIPEIKVAYQKLRGFLKAQEFKQAERALVAFEVAVLSSADLISSDAEKITENVQAETRRILSLKTRGVRRLITKELPEPDQLNIFEKNG